MKVRKETIVPKKYNTKLNDKPKLVWRLSDVLPLSQDQEYINTAVNTKMVFVQITKTVSTITKHSTNAFV